MRRTVPKLARLGVLIAVAYAGAMSVALCYAYADLEEMALGFGAEMMRYAHADRQDKPRTLYINGQLLRLSVASSKNTVDEVLDYFEARCAQRDGGISEQLAELAARAHKVPPSRASLWTGTIRHEAEERGMIACLDMGDPSRSAFDRLRSVRDFLESGDLSEVGFLRYVYVEGGPKWTTMAAFWVDGSLNVGRMFPSEGDAPGEDLADVPRPPASRRLLTAQEWGHPHGLRSFVDSKMSADELSRFYKRHLSKRGWTLLESPKPTGALPETALVAEQGQRMIALVLGEDADRRGMATIVTLH